MHTTTQDLKKELDKSVKLLQTLRDEIRVQLHLGGMDIKSEWNRLEPRLEDVLQRAARDASDVTQKAVDEMTASVRKVRESLTKR